jgi:circadian clock protein KaiB
MNSARPDDFWDLRLYITGRTPKSMAVLSRLKDTCERHCEGRYRITVIDLVKQPQRASADQIVATPTVIRKWPLPARIFIGNLSTDSELLVDVSRCHAG